ncbi:hypothetical protein HanXRQr2_Chr03g0088371 [Helianthus annuus]|uniref:Uncharacterized protein n=1 Tax=Helianthus annuus TaxID=4232 RepID=A0A9K3JCN8_HELAN|nr:hypothetical protein HanXRQr2_Chr03g0088371 [Helianthus annuus]
MVPVVSTFFTFSPHLLKIAGMLPMVCHFDIEREKQRSENPEAMEEDVEDESPNSWFAPVRVRGSGSRFARWHEFGTDGGRFISVRSGTLFRYGVPFIMFILYFFVYKLISLKTKCKLVKIEGVKC